MEPPRILMLRVEPEVKVRIEIFAENEVSPRDMNWVCAAQSSDQTDAWFDRWLIVPRLRRA